jgi:hypothetical protein
MGRSRWDSMMRSSSLSSNTGSCFFLSFTSVQPLPTMLLQTQMDYSARSYIYIYIYSTVQYIIKVTQTNNINTSWIQMNMTSPTRSRVFSYVISRYSIEAFQHRKNEVPCPTMWLKVFQWHLYLNNYFWYSLPEFPHKTRDTMQWCAVSNSSQTFWAIKGAIMLALKRYKFPLLSKRKKN